MPDPDWTWRSPPNWPPPPPGWVPPPGWRPPFDWPPAPPGWSFWAAAQPAEWETELSAPVVVADGPGRRSLVWETRFVMLAFLLPSVSSAVIVLVQHVSGVGTITRFPVIVPGHPITNLIVGILQYFSVAAVVPVALFLLLRSGQGPASLGLGLPSWRLDIWPALGLILASFGAELALALVLSPALSRTETKISTGNVPGYYVIWGLAISAITAIAEEVIVNGYLITRLGQLGWTPKSALILSLSLRTSYHVYYGLGFLLTIPFGYFVTRSFQKHHRLNRSIAAHFLYDAIVTTISILA